MLLRDFKCINSMVNLNGALVTVSLLEIVRFYESLWYLVQMVPKDAKSAICIH